MKQYILLVALCLGLGLSTAYAQQNYITAIGLHAGNPTSLTYKSFVTERSAIEGLLGYSSRGVVLTGLYEFHLPIGFYGAFYFGAGGSIGVKSNLFSPAVDGVLGLEYTFDTTPLNLGLHWKPIYRFDKVAPGMDYYNAALIIRYVISQ